jgi:hypothetical protein
MTCQACQHAVNGRIGEKCPMRPYVASTYAGGCNYAEVDNKARLEEASRLASLPDVPMFDKSERKAERELQAACEGWLSIRGYRRMTDREIIKAVESEYPCRGWFGHLAQPRGNPLMPDLWITDRTMRRVLPIELKVRSNYQPGQREFINAGLWLEVREFCEFERLVTAWEKSC